MDTVIDVCGSRVYTMQFNHCMLAPLSVTDNGVNVPVQPASSFLAMMYHEAYKKATSEAGTLGTVYYANLRCSTFIRNVLLYIKANEVSYGV
jgi:hypothetical protein